MIQPSPIFLAITLFLIHAFFSISSQYRLNSIRFGRIPDLEDKIALNTRTRLMIPNTVSTVDLRLPLSQGV